MTDVRTRIIGCIGAFAFVASAEAADPAQTWRRPPPELAYEKPEPRYRELMSGWYLRGDLGYRWNQVGSFTSTNPTTSAKFSDTWAFGGGFGFKYHWFRADLTLDRGAPAKIAGTTAAATQQPQYSAKLTTLTALANAYIDFGTWSGVTPYVGAGAGVTRVTSNNYADTVSGPSPTITGPGAANSFSWAWMAGVAVRVSPSWMIDVGFRHLELGKALSVKGAGSTNSAAIFNDLSANEVRVGLRYLFD
jgi:opacity protein-like surface antigen